MIGRRTPATLDVIVGTLLPAFPRLDPEARRTVEQHVIVSVSALVAAMPRHLQLPYRLGLSAFDWLALPAAGRRFRRLPLASRARYVDLWTNAPLPPARDFVKLLRSTALLAYFDHPLVSDALAQHVRLSNT